MPCIFDIKPEDRHCLYCSATLCDERQPKPIKTHTTNKIEQYDIDLFRKVDYSLRGMYSSYVVRIP